MIQLKIKIRLEILVSFDRTSGRQDHLAVDGYLFHHEFIYAVPEIQKTRQGRPDVDR